MVQMFYQNSILRGPLIVLQSAQEPASLIAERGFFVGKKLPDEDSGPRRAGRAVAGRTPSEKWVVTTPFCLTPIKL